VLRDSHLGSIWEGTSNIVALDVARATRREGALVALRGHLERLLAECGTVPEGLAEAMTRACDLMEAVASDKTREGEVRTAASAVYNAASAVIMAWEEARISGSSGGRARLAGLVLRHKLLPRDPLAEGAAEEDGALLEQALAEAEPMLEAAE
jgi:acyl-CoA dehydrogenase